MTKTLEDRVQQLHNLTEVAVSPGNAHSSQYMRGMANGMLIASSVFTDQEPVFVLPDQVKDDSESKLAGAMYFLDRSAKMFRIYQGQHQGKAMDTKRSESERLQAREKATVNEVHAEALERFIAYANVETYHDLAMRTAAPNTVFHYPFDDPAAGDEIHFELLNAFAEFVASASKLDRWKSQLFYGKDKPTVSSHQVMVRLVTTAGLGDLDGIEVALAKLPSPQFLHAILGIGSEAGEIIEDALVLVCTNDMDIREATLSNITRETGDIDWFQELLALSTGVSVEDARKVNIARLRKRFPGKFSEADAVARADEDTILQGGGRIDMSASNLPHPEGDKIVVIFGPAASGKTRHAEEFRVNYHSRKVVDDWNGETKLEGGDLVLLTSDAGDVRSFSHLMSSGVFPGGTRVEFVGIERALQEIGRS